MARGLLKPNGVGKQYLLSLEISRARALLASGAPAGPVHDSLRAWALQAPMRGLRRVNPALVEWSRKLGAVVKESVPLGAPVGRLFSEVNPIIRREEKRWVKLQAVQKQLGFQGAIAVVLPWAVASLTNGIELNLFTAAGALCQLVGLGAYTALVHQTTRPREAERDWVFHFLVSSWMRVLAGFSLHAALEASLDEKSGLQAAGMSKRGQRLDSACRGAWKQWLRAVDGGSSAMSTFTWKGPASAPRMEASHEAARLLLSLIQSGAPAGSALWDFVSQLDDERQSEFEERLDGLPTRLSLVFCLFLAPAVFLVLMGALWPALSVLSI